MNLFSTFFSVLLTTYLGKHLGPKKIKNKKSISVQSSVNITKPLFPPLIHFKSLNLIMNKIFRISECIYSLS